MLAPSPDLLPLLKRGISEVLAPMGVNVLVFEAGNPYHFVEIRGVADEADGADEHINALAKKYIGQDEYPYRQPGEQRVKFVIEPQRVRHVQQR